MTNLKEKIEEIRMNAYVDWADGAEEEYIESLLTLFHTEAESLIGSDDDIVYANGDLRELAIYHEKEGRNSLRAEQRNKLTK
jgi:hypothetical protein